MKTKQKKKTKKNTKKEEKLRKSNKDILPIRYYDDHANAFVLEDGSYLEIIEKTADDIDNMMEDEIQMLMIDFAKFLKLYKDDLKIITMNFPTNTLAQQKYWAKKRQETANPIHKKWNSLSISELEKVDKGTRKREYYFMVLSKSLEEHYDHMKQIRILGESVRRISMEKKIQILYKLCNMNSLVTQNEQEEQAWDEAEAQMQEAVSVEAQTEEERIDLPLFSYIQPQGGITFKEPNYIITGDGYTKIVHIYRLPTTLKDFWLSHITQQQDCISMIDISTRDKNEVKRNINKALQEEYSREKNAVDYEEIYDAKKRQHQLEKMYDEVQSMGEVVKMMHFRIFVSGKSLVGVEEKCGEIMKNMEGDDFMPTVMLNEGEREWKSIFQSYTTQMREPFAMKGLSLMTEQIAGGYPFRFSSLDDKDGSLLGFTNCGGAVVYNEFAKTERRKHYNTIAIGDMGSGKSTFLKKRFRSRAERGDFIRCFDISGEFTNLTREFGGKIIKCDGNSGMLNPLEILRSGDDERTNYGRHISKVGVFYRCLVPSATDRNIIELENILRSLYEEYDLVPNGKNRITGLPANRYPTFSDLLSFIKNEIERKSNEAETANDAQKSLIVDEVHQMHDIAKALSTLVGNYGQMFDGHTTIDNIVDEKIVTFDISTIKDMDNIFVAQLFNMVYFCWDNCVANGSLMKEMYETGKVAFEDVVRSLILIDESHRWVNTKYPYILDLVIVIMREARKYFAGIMMASQSFRDYAPQGASSEAVERLKVVFELTQYKFIFKQDSSVLPLIDELFGRMLSPWQREKIPFLGQGETILSISGDRNIYFKVWLSKQYEQRLFAGGA